MSLWCTLNPCFLDEKQSLWSDPFKKRHPVEIRVCSHLVEESTRDPVLLLALEVAASIAHCCFAG